MKLKFLYLFLLVFLNVSVFAEELQAEFFFEDKVSMLKEGDVVVGTLRVWPIENARSEEFDKLVGKNLFDSFYLSDVVSSSPSENNADVYELKAHFIVVNKVNPDKLVFTYGNQSAHVRYREVLFKPLEKKAESFYVLDQSIESNIIIALLVGLLGTIFLILFYKKREWIKAKFKKKSIQTPIERYKELFLNAKERSDFERVYSEKENWLALIEEKAPAYFEFFKVLNNHQYKKEWNEEDLNEVKEAFEVIRRSFK